MPGLIVYRVFMETDSLKKKFETAFLSVDRVAVFGLFTELSVEISPIRLIEEIITPVLYRIGEEWDKGNVSLAQYYMSGRICEDIVKRFLPFPADTEAAGPDMAIAVLEDYHVLGKRIVYSVVRSAGFRIADYGSGRSVEDLVRRVREDGISMLLVSVLMLRSALRVADLRKQLDEGGLKPVIIVGGAPFLFDDELWRRVGADAMGRTATDAVALIKRFKGERP